MFLTKCGRVTLKGTIHELKNFSIVWQKDPVENETERTLQRVGHNRLYTPEENLLKLLDNSRVPFPFQLLIFKGLCGLDDRDL